MDAAVSPHNRDNLPGAPRRLSQLDLYTSCSLYKIHLCI